jgi:hypothetical protein
VWGGWVGVGEGGVGVLWVGRWVVWVVWVAGSGEAATSATVEGRGSNTHIQQQTSKQ